MRWFGAGEWNSRLLKHEADLRRRGLESAKADLVWLLLRHMHRTLPPAVAVQVFQLPECSSKRKDVSVSNAYSTVGEGTTFTVALPMAK